MKLTALAVVILAFGIGLGLALRDTAFDRPASADPPCPGAPTYSRNSRLRTPSIGHELSEVRPQLLSNVGNFVFHRRVLIVVKPGF